MSIRIGSLSTTPARTAFTRWCRFNLVGVIGMAFQLAWVAALGRLLPARPLLVTATALELTLLHNFLWHQRYTWRGRGVELRPFQTVTRLLRFHLSNGAVSFAGNLLLVRLLMAPPALDPGDGRGHRLLLARQLFAGRALGLCRRFAAGLLACYRSIRFVPLACPGVRLIFLMGRRARDVRRFCEGNHGSTTGCN